MKKIILGVAILAAQLSFAQENKQDKNIEEVTILGRKKIKQERKEFSRHAQSVETLSEEELNRNNSAMIEQTLSTMAGVQVDKRTNFGGQRVVVRGYGNDQKFNNWGTKFYLNGIPLTNADGVTVLEDLDFSLVNNIEVVKGPAATMYGGGVGGAVRFYIRPTDVKGTSVSEKLTLGSFNHFQSQTKLESKTDNASLLFNYNHLESDGYRPNGNTLKNNYAFLGGFKLNSKQELSVYAAHNNSFEGVSGQIPFSNYYAGNDPGNKAYISRGAGNKFISNRAYINHNWKITENFSNNTSVFYSSLDTKRIAAGAFETSQNPNYGLRSVFNWKKSLSNDFVNNIELGVEHLISKSLVSNYRFAGLESNPMQVQAIGKGSYFNYNNNNTSVFVIDRIKYLPWDLTLLLGMSGNKLSYDREDLLALQGLVSGYNKNLSFQKKFPIVFTPHIALQKEWKQQIFNLSYSEGYNAPTATTAFIGGNLNVTNDNLKPERAKMWDFSIHGLLFNTKFDYQVSAFRINYFDKLSQLTIPDPVVSGGTINYWANTGSQRNSGIEASLGYQHTSESFFNKIVPFVNFSYYDARYVDFVDKSPEDSKPVNYAGKRVVGVPKSKYAAGLDISTKPGFYLLATYNYLGDVYTNFANSDSKNVKGFGLLNSKIGYKQSFGKIDVDAFLMGNNLTNQINYTFLFLGNNINDKDADSGFADTTDVNPGPSKAYYFYGLNIKYNF